MLSSVSLRRQAALVEVGAHFAWTMWSYIDRTGHKGLKSTAFEDIEPGFKSAAGTIRLVADLADALGSDERAIHWLNRAIERAQTGAA